MQLNEKQLNDFGKGTWNNEKDAINMDMEGELGWLAQMDCEE